MTRMMVIVTTLGAMVFLAYAVSSHAAPAAGPGRDTATAAARR